MSGVQTDCKVYVNVRAAFLPDGKMLPEELTWEDGTSADAVFPRRWDSVF